MKRFLALLLLSLAAWLPAATERPGLSAGDVFSLELANQPHISADGRRIVYVRNFADIMTDKRRSNLWIVNSDGSEHRPLTSGNFGDTSPRWSPDGTQIAFLSDREGTTQIHRIWVDSGQISRLTNIENAPSGIAWSPDGKWISFVAHVSIKARQIVQMPEPPSGAKWAEPARVIDRLVYRYNGNGYLKPGFSHLFVVPAEGGTPRQISSGDFPHAGPVVRASSPAWTPDGKWLILSANRHPDYETEPLNTEVYEFSVADGTVRALTDRKGPDNEPAISPDGKLIAFTGFDDRYHGYQVTHLYVMNRDGSAVRPLTPDWDRDVDNIRWAPEGNGIYFTSNDQGNTGLYFVSLDGKRRQFARNLGSTASAYGGAPDFTISRTGVLALTQTRPDLPGDIAVVNVVTPKSFKLLTAVNEDLLADRSLGQVEDFWFESSKDKRKIQGWIMKPPGFNPSKKYPLILEIHGGPFANYGDRFDLEKQVMAARGYVVLYVNPRGSTSYGGEFGDLIHHAYPGDDFYDLNSGVDAVIAKGFIDRDHLYVTGGSGGGVLTCWMIGRTPRFRAAVTVYPVINWYSFVLTSDIGNWTSKYWFPGLPWDNVQHYEQRSLLSVVKNVKTPTMVLTGEEDYRTPMSDSEQYYQALKLLGVESVLVRVPGEPHGISRIPSHHVSKILHIVSWFDSHK